MFCFTQVWDLHTLQCTMTMSAHKDVVTCIICTDQYLISSSLDGTVKIWRVTEQETLELNKEHKEEHVSYFTLLCHLLVISLAA